MNNFIYHNPTKLVFGKGQIARLGKLIPADKKIMITFGGGSVRRNGVYDQVVKALEGRDWVEFWGIEPNPSVETVREAVALGRENGSDFLLAVGGGSVIDGTKLIAAGLLYDGDPWDIVLKGQADKTVPLGTVLTMSATGSEMNSGSVISRQETKEKYARNAKKETPVQMRSRRHARRQRPAANGNKNKAAGNGSLIYIRIALRANPD